MTNKQRKYYLSDDYDTWEVSRNEYVRNEHANHQLDKFCAIGTVVCLILLALIAL